MSEFRTQNCHTDELQHVTPSSTTARGLLCKLANRLGPITKATVMSLPREVIPGRFYMVTRRCTQRQFLLRPDDDTNNAFIYCLAEAAQRFEVQILLPIAMSNHYHVILYDPQGNLPRFTEHFHKMLAKCLNARWRRWENFWASEQVCVVHLVDRDAVLDKLIYAAANPVKARLVDTAQHWPGVNGLRALLTRRTLHARRPHYFFRRNGTMPERVTLRLAIPPQLDDADQLCAQLRDGVAAVEATMTAYRKRTGACVLGRHAVKHQSWRAAPTSPALRRRLRPRLATRSRWSRLEAILRNRAFIDAYQAARARWLAGDTTVLWPPGTYWMRQFANVQVAA